MNYFSPTPTTCEELKKMYRALAHKHHPDCGGCTQAMQAINAEYKALFAKLKNVHVNAEGEAYHKHTDEVPEEFIEIINRLIRMENIVIEVIGTFLWVSGNTKPYKEDLKSMRFKWHTKKVCWYLAPEDYRKRNRKEYSMDELREMYNSQTIGTAPYKRVTMAVANA
ncbi:MAG: molecular chaperone DnaJ [Defluviitaleaceae bacterium]|nr:molecular chaperone DnaJ [Defluviitaleaceae bacterium]